MLQKPLFIDLVFFLFSMWLLAHPRSQDWSLLFFLPLYSLSFFCSFFQFMDLTSLQDTLPDLHTTTDYSGSLAQPWVSQNSAMPYIPSGPQGICPLHQINHHAQIRKCRNMENLTVNAKPDSFFKKKLFQEGYPTWLDKTLICCKFLESCTCNC